MSIIILVENYEMHPTSYDFRILDINFSQNLKKTIKFWVFLPFCRSSRPRRGHPLSKFWKVVEQKLFLMIVCNFLDYSFRQFSSLKFSHTKTLQPNDHLDIRLRLTWHSVGHLGACCCAQLSFSRSFGSANKSLGSRSLANGLNVRESVLTSNWFVFRLLARKLPKYPTGIEKENKQKIKPLNELYLGFYHLFR
jgi:hypothetical protein